jgi:hypothetical protein
MMVESANPIQILILHFNQKINLANFAIYVPLAPQLF